MVEAFGRDAGGLAQNRFPISVPRGLLRHLHAYDKKLMA